MSSKRQQPLWSPPEGGSDEPKLKLYNSLTRYGFYKKKGLKKIFLYIVFISGIKKCSYLKMEPQLPGTIVVQPFMMLRIWVTPEPI